MHVGLAADERLERLRQRDGRTCAGPVTTPISGLATTYGQHWKNVRHWTDQRPPLSVALSRRCLLARPRYFFHVKSGQLTVLDREGVELGDIANAIKEAARWAQEIVSKDVLQGVSAVSRVIIIADDEWRTVTELPF